MQRAILLILDGWGLREEKKDNAIALAHTPNFDNLWKNAPHTSLSASGEDVGLTRGQMGNSEVGHINIGAGRLVLMDLPRINESIKDGSFKRNLALRNFAEKMSASGGTVHLLGLVSEGGIHSYSTHIIALANYLTDLSIPVTIHAFVDGRDTPPKNAHHELELLESGLKDSSKVNIATICGRYFAMDRDNRWERTSRVYDLIVSGHGKSAENWRDAIDMAYARGESDEFVQPTCVNGYNGTNSKDGLIMANYRADRVRQLLAALLDPQFDTFKTENRPKFAASIGMVEYSEEHNRYINTIFSPPIVKNSLGEWLAQKGLKQFRIAETEKYPHVTFFFNGGEEKPWLGEDREMIPSPKVATYDLQPEMSEASVTTELVKAIRSRKYDFLLCNYANPDMVGHSGDLNVTILAVEAVDRGLGQVMQAAKDTGTALLIISDHGNSEMMVDPKSGDPHTAHTLSPVPAILYAPHISGVTFADDGKLANIAPTILDIMNIEKPAEMDHDSLLIRGDD